MDKTTSRRRARATESLSKALRAAEAAESKRAENVVVLDLRDLTLVTDYFVICTGGSRVQIRAIVDGVDEAMADRAPEVGARALREGDAEAQWVLIDFGDVVVHVFGPEARAFYRLERLWGNARVVAR
ncbi:MAG: ribosome silencing factor [bacterium]